MTTSATLIHRLKPEVANQIAAGEVVNRPSSAIKELIDNAIDAQASRILVEVDGGGVARMGVTDNGTGMSRADAELCLQRHATSKLVHADDLHHIVTMGFRGEALASLASVSRLRLLTRRHEDDEGTQVITEGGLAPSIEPAGGPVGTTVELRDLFFNVPARRKFLRAISTESGHVTQAVKAAALAQPNIHFELRRDGRRTLQYLATDNGHHRCGDVLGTTDLWPCAGERGPLRIVAYLAGPKAARANRGALWLFVNRRRIQDRSLARAVVVAFGNHLLSGQFPLGCLFVDVPPEDVDVNVHPQKSEVRFAHARAVSEAVRQVLALELKRRLPAPARSGLNDLAGTGFATNPRHHPQAWAREQPLEDGATSGWTFPAGGPTEAPSENHSHRRALKAVAEPGSLGFGGSLARGLGVAAQEGACWRVANDLLLQRCGRVLRLYRRSDVIEAQLTQHLLEAIQNRSCHRTRLVFPQPIADATAVAAHAEPFAEMGFDLVNSRDPGSGEAQTVMAHTIPTFSKGVALDKTVAAFAEVATLWGAQQFAPMLAKRMAPHLAQLPQTEFAQGALGALAPLAEFDLSPHLPDDPEPKKVAPTEDAP